MFKKMLSAYRPCVMILLAMMAAVGGFALVAKAQPRTGSDNATLAGKWVKTGLYLISGGGANSLLRLSAAGFILVDGKLPNNYAALMAKIKHISLFLDLPVQVVIVTNYHEDRCGTNAKFLAAGVPIIAQENVKSNLVSYHPTDGKVAPPTITYGRDYTLRLGGVEARLMHFGNAYTDGDTVIYFPNLKVVAIGNLFTPNTPDPDFSAGGSLVDWGPVLAQILKLDFDIVVPSTGPMITRDELVAFKTKIDILVSRARGLVEKGVRKDQLLTQLNTDDLGWRFRFTGGDLDRFYTELSSGKAVSEHSTQKQVPPE
jgi:glyoxylase-like metal-dependent hydrolase (beta-lactamase superfamily II)